MSELPELRRADCGHFIPADEPPAGRHRNGVHDQDVYLCDGCRERLNARKVETKVVEPGHAEPLRDGDQVRMETKVVVADSPRALGAKVAREGGTEGDCPFVDRRTRDAKEWLRGFREARDG